VHLEYSPEQESLRKALREYFAELLGDDAQAELGHPGEGDPRFRAVVRQMGADGWLGIGWPKAPVGQDRPGERGLADDGAGVQGRPPLATADSAHFRWYAPFGLLTPAQWVAMFARRIMHEFGVTSEDFGRVAVADRRHAATNPAAFYYQRPITLEDHQQSRWIVEPLHLLDCCQESDGAQAMVVTTTERSRDLRRPPAVIRAAAQGASHEQQMMTSYYRSSITGLPEMGLVARQLWATAGIGPEDVQTAVIYDHFTPFVLPQLEEFGFCARGEAQDFIRDGNIELGGRLPINTNGGQLGEAYIHGMNGIAEGVRQVRGTAVNQVDDVTHVLVTAGTGSPPAGSSWESTAERWGRATPGAFRRRVEGRPLRSPRCLHGVLP
jgi:acetyl-CoA acetyltransferase